VKKSILKILFLIILFPLFTFAQGTAIDPTLPPSDGGVVTPEPSSSATPAEPVSVTAPALTPAPSSAVTPKPAPASSPSATPIPVLPSTAQTKTSTDPLVPAPQTNSKNYISFVLGALAVGLGTFLFVKLNSKKDKNDDKKCGNIKKLMEEKLNDVTDLKSQLASLATKEASKQVKSITKSTSTEKLIALIENTSRDYAKLKDLYEKCIASFPNAKKVLIFHGTEGYPEENWFPWLKEKIETKGLKVFVPQFPTPPIVPAKISEWLEVLKKYENEINENTILVGHSLGGVFTLRILEKLQNPVKAVFLTGTPIGIQPILNYDRDNSFSGFDFDWDKIKANAKHFTVFHSDNDPYVGLENGKELAKKTWSRTLFCAKCRTF
jgi:predicted alpha/beta hydrolase family esterase